MATAIPPCRVERQQIQVMGFPMGSPALCAPLATLSSSPWECPARPSPNRRCLNKEWGWRGGTATPGFAPLGPFALLGKESERGTVSPRPTTPLRKGSNNTTTNKSNY